ncbi:MAG: hypothetical protein ACRD19_09600, partial [Terriglobia bacterium]
LVNVLRDIPMTQFSIQWILSLNPLCQKWGQVHVEDPDRLEKETRKAILRNKPRNIRAYLADKVTDLTMLDVAVAIVEVGVKVIAAWR